MKIWVGFLLAVFFLLCGLYFFSEDDSLNPETQQEILRVIEKSIKHLEAGSEALTAFPSDNVDSNMMTLKEQTTALVAGMGAIADIVTNITPEKVQWARDMIYAVTGKKINKVSELAQFIGPLAGQAVMLGSAVAAYAAVSDAQHNLHVAKQYCSSQHRKIRLINQKIDNAGKKCNTIQTGLFKITQMEDMPVQQLNKWLLMSENLEKDVDKIVQHLRDLEPMRERALKRRVEARTTAGVKVFAALLTPFVLWPIAPLQLPAIVSAAGLAIAGNLQPTAWEVCRISLMKLTPNINTIKQREMIILPVRSTGNWLTPSKPR